MHYVIRYKKSKIQKNWTEKMVTANSDLEALQRENKRDTQFKDLNLINYIRTIENGMIVLTHKIIIYGDNK